MKSVRFELWTILPKPDSCSFATEVYHKTVRVSKCWNPNHEIALEVCFIWAASTTSPTQRQHNPLGNLWQEGCGVDGLLSP